MRKLGALLLSTLVLTFVVAGIASSDPIDSGEARGAGWSVVVPGVGSVELTAEAVASCPAGPDPCNDSASNQQLSASAFTVASAGALRSEANASRESVLAATLQGTMDAAATPTLPNGWNTRGYAHAENVSLLNGAITVTSVESETVTAVDGGNVVKATGARVVGLQLAGVLAVYSLAPIVPDQPNQVLLDNAVVRIVYWETNWDPATATTTNNDPPMVTALRVIDKTTNTDIKLAQTTARSAKVAINQPPVAANDSGTTDQNTAVTVNVVNNDSDPDGDALTLSGSGNSAQGGTFSCSGSSCTYTPANGFSGTDTFNYTVCDPSNQCATATVTITVNAVAPPGNAPPNAVNDNDSTRIDDPVTVNVTTNDSDPEGNLIENTVAVTQQPTNGTVTCDDNLCTYTPNSNFVGTDTFTYEVCDNVGLCDTAVVTITVTNEGPIANDDNATTNLNASVTIPVTANDTDDDGNLVPGSVTVTQPATNGAVVCSNGSCTYTPSNGYSGPDSFTYRVCDSKNLCDTAVVNITIDPAPPAGPVNQPPTAVNDSATTTIGTAVPIDVMTNDSDDDGTLDPASVTFVSGAANGSVICNNGSCTYTPQAGWSGTDTFVYRVCDNESACDTATVTVTVSGTAPAGTNVAPDAQDDSRSTGYNTAVTVNVVNNDSDADGNLVPNAAVVDHPDDGAVDCIGGSCTYTPATGFSGTDTFTYRVCDSDGACDEAQVTITVAPAPGGGAGGGGGGGGGGAPANQPPNAVNDASTTPAGSPVTINVIPNDTDPDNNLSDTVTIVRHPANGAVICDQGQCTYTPASGFSGTDSFDYRICDTANACSTATVTITVAAPPANNTGGGGNTGGTGNQPPDARDDTVNTQGGSPVTITVLPNDSDPDGNLDNTTVTITRQPADGAVVCNGGTCTYTPAPGFSGTDSFEYRVCDTLNVCDTAVVTIVVGPGNGTGNNEPPVARDDTKTGRPGAPVTIGVINNDSDPDGDLDPGSVTVTVPPANGSVICVQGTCTYTPEPGFSGNDSFDYRVCDFFGACTTATVTINVPSLNVGEGDGGGNGGNGNGGNGGDGPGNNGGGPGSGGNGGDGPGSDDDPALPGDTPPNAPINLDRPLLGAPNAPLPFTGGDPSFYLGAALNLLLLGMLLLVIERFTRASRSMKPCPAWHNHAEAHDSHGCAYGEWS